MFSERCRLHTRSLEISYGRSETDFSGSLPPLAAPDGNTTRRRVAKNNATIIPSPGGTLHDKNGHHLSVTSAPLASSSPPGFGSEITSYLNALGTVYFIKFLDVRKKIRTGVDLYFPSLFRFFAYPPRYIRRRVTPASIYSTKIRYLFERNTLPRTFVYNTGATSVFDDVTTISRRPIQFRSHSRTRNEQRCSPLDPLHHHKPSATATVELLFENRSHTIERN